MKKILLWALCLLPFAGLMSCEDMLNTDTDHYLNSGDHQLNSPNDTLYSMVGILRKVQTLADRYVLVGELRGDLMDITPNADLDLQAISNFDFDLTRDNPYLDTRPYYDIINNCNLFIQRTDTANSAPKNVMYKELAAVKTIRAWVYMQLILNYGKACYYTDPILTVEDMENIKKNSEVWLTDLSSLGARVQEDLLDAMDVQRSLGNPYYDGIEGIEKAFIPAQLVLADLFLSDGRYETAAYLYGGYLFQQQLVTGNRILFWANTGFTGNDIGSSVGTNERITDIYTNSDTGVGSQLTALSSPTEWSTTFGMECSYQIKPSEASKNTWNKQIYAYLPSGATALDSLTYTTGDLRGTRKRVFSPNSILLVSPTYITDSYESFLVSETDTVPFITKYGTMEGMVRIYRTGLVYLRFAEALNRLNKPSLAFAILKYGAQDAVLADPAKVNPAELTNIGFWYFPAAIFSKDMQIGMHSRGSGASDRNKYYDFPATCTTSGDSIRFVDEMLIDEMAMETAFEGNRFQDLMRFDKYSKEYDEEHRSETFLADRVASRRGTTVINSSLFEKLKQKENWYLPHN